MRKIFGVILICMFFIMACSSPRQSGPNAGRGFSSVLKGLKQLILSPLQIAAGLLEGVASLPYYAATSLSDINKGLISANAKISLDDTYESAYGKRISEVDPSGDTGEVFRRMKHASEYFQKVLQRYGVPNSSNYFLASIDTANKQGYTLFSVVYRPTKNITVIDKYDGKTVRNFSSSDRLFYEPFQTDIKGNPLDTIIDYAGMPLDQYGTQKQQAILLTLAANAVASDKKRSDYWGAEKRWIDGQFEEILKSQSQKVEKSMGI